MQRAYEHQFLNRIMRIRRQLTLEWVSWYNTQRLLEPIGYVPPVEYEAHYYRSQQTHAMVAGVT